jgi:hypothetical protein
LLPGDRVVTVKKDTLPPFLVFDGKAPIETVVDNALLHDTIVIAQGLTSDGELIGGGTWIRGWVAGTVTEVLKTGLPGGVSARISFWHDDGQAFLKNVLVKAGTYPVFFPEQRYLLFLARDDNGRLYLGRGFRLTEKGSLGALMLSSGELDVRTSRLHGQPADKVVKMLKERGRKE